MLLDKDGNPILAEPETVRFISINGSEFAVPVEVAEDLVRKNEQAKEQFYRTAGERWLLTSGDLKEMRRLGDPLKALEYAGERMFKRWREATLENAKLRRILKSSGVPTGRPGTRSE